MKFKLAWLFFVYMKISLLLHYRTITFDYEMILLLVKKTVKYLLKVPLVKPFWKLKEHLFFGYFGVCICETHRQCYQCNGLLGLWPYKKRIIFFIERPLKMMKNAINFILKALFIFKIFKFLSLFGQVGKMAWLEG